ncbi:M15 family metallopeptidase [Listeria ivanovii]|uniref:Putative similar to D-alanyl-D-alanine carboxypeptidase n=1 Tax=Listeria ivanovii (strain ATCC BAA-678 / PAM 55) TaxID=881621 RepID=G2ZC19_LISIP|nr:D-alanyl-D-alanine carboxypeptidase family protein [Listeria ivanovii]AHI56366.1 D-alanyl-D-alanine carboxypeptidase [Listeria ivanovii WSLC3009]AIS65793.1 D-alanyl-D-alanine carboxypeptidase [Listeria ivanovii subsp. ivanovii]MBC1759176.1 D-alanyl-D-alanine carboxypeptidase family protein [Listeria ivanovii]MBK3914198.1 D-alanyl-D-alanine carboxypeptidase family protein [Listeria ivanovii subsp. ivanovii]MBK3920964.1 D-alanyl-D-alanine carboxypeptidase family protein [Listeria ivanovii sub
MSSLLTIALAVSLSCVHTVEDQYFGGQNAEPVAEVNQKTASGSNTLDELEKDPLYPYIDKQNKLVEKNGIQYIENEENMLVLANKDYSLQPTYTPPDLVRPNVTFSFGDEKIEKAQMRKEAGTALEEMFQAANDNGYKLFAVSGYRSYKRQQEVFQAEVNSKGDAKAREAVAYPGTSEHQTGLAMDISSESQSYELTDAFGNTPEGKWLQENAHNYGFILRYMKGREDITKYQYESWHYRYVGKDAATIIYENDWTLEEFFNHVKALQKKVDAAK